MSAARNVVASNRPAFLASWTLVIATIFTAVTW